MSKQERDRQKTVSERKARRPSERERGRRALSKQESEGQTDRKRQSVSQREARKPSERESEKQKGSQ